VTLDKRVDSRSGSVNGANRLELSAEISASRVGSASVNANLAADSFGDSYQSALIARAHPQHQVSRDLIPSASLMMIARILLDLNLIDRSRSSSTTRGTLLVASIVRVAGEKLRR